MKLSKYKVGQIVYEVAINISNETPTVSPQKILCVGKTTLYVVGESAEWGLNHGEQILSIHSFENLKKEEIIKSSHCHLWTDTLEKAESLKVTIEKILETKKELLTA